MPITGNGVDSCLELPAKVVSGYPYTEIFYASFTDSGSVHFYTGQSSTTNPDLYEGIYYNGSGGKILVESYGSGFQVSAGLSTAPDPGPGALTLFMAVHTSASSRTLYCGSATGNTNTNVATDVIPSYGRTTVGAAHFGSSALKWFMKGAMAEVHWVGAALTSADFTLLLGGKKAETFAGWIDGLPLDVYQPSGNYVSLGGTRTFVASGTWAASALPHPVSRATPTTVAIGANDPNDTVAVNVNVVGSATAAVAVTEPNDTVAVGLTTTVVTAGLTTCVFHRNSGSIRANEALDALNIYNAATGALALRLTGINTNAQGRVVVSASAALSPGVSYAYEAVFAQNGRRLPVKAAA